MLVFVLILIILALIFMPYLMRMGQRFSLLLLVKRICARKRYMMKRSGIFTFLMKNLSDEYDLLISTERKIYRIKFWNEYYRGTALVFENDGGITRMKRKESVFRENDKKDLSFYQRSVGVLSLKQREVLGKKEVDVFLMGGNCNVFVRQENGELRKITFGEKIHGMILSDKKRFSKEFLHNAKY